MKFLVDTSVWVSHFKKSDEILIKLLRNDEVVIHPFVVQELYLGRPEGKEFIFDRLRKLHIVQTISTDSLMEFVDKNSIVGKGIGIVDTHLLAAADKYRLKFFTYDKKLKALADKIL